MHEANDSSPLRGAQALPAEDADAPTATPPPGGDTTGLPPSGPDPEGGTPETLETVGTRRTRVLIVDDHPLLLRGLRAALLSFPDFEIVGEASSGEEAVRRFAAVRPDIVLMDLVMPGMGGIGAIRRILELTPEAKILVVSNYEEGDRVQQAFQAGAVGYQAKGAQIEDLVMAIRQAVRGISSLASSAVQALIQTTRQARQLGDDLSDRELEVLTLLAQGLTNRAIADRMVVAVSTVKFHLHSIRAKLGTTTRTETVAVALQNHLITLL
jgi:NarL family two-component system response regulator LiaR